MDIFKIGCSSASENRYSYFVVNSAISHKPRGFQAHSQKFVLEDLDFVNLCYAKFYPLKN